jgi:PIN domain nuclease of toxin-antitoxin system
VKLLLDTHAVLWLLSDPDQLSAGARTALVDPAARVGASIATLWEIAIKHGLGRLDQPPAVVAAGLDEAGVDLVGLDLADVVALGTLASHHRDPFDRILVAQALAGGWTLVTRDRMLRRYGVPVLQA